MLPYPALPLGSRSWTPGHIDGSEQLSYVDICSGMLQVHCPPKFLNRIEEFFLPEDGRTETHKHVKSFSKLWKTHVGI